MSRRIANGASIRAIRESQGVRGSDFATRCLISHAYLSNIEAGRKQPTPEVLSRIAVELGYGIDAVSFVCQDCSAVAA